MCFVKPLTITQQQKEYIVSSRSYCCAKYDQLLHLHIRDTVDALYKCMILTYLLTSSVRPSICDAVHCRTHGHCRGSKVVLSHSYQGTSYSL